MGSQQTKNDLRLRIWSLLEQRSVHRFPGAKGRIPNFVGAEDAARVLEELEPWLQAKRLKCNPDSPQFPVRKAALARNAVVYMAVPRLAAAEPFLELDPDRLEVAPHKAASIKGASRHGVATSLDDLPEIDLVIAGSVAVSRSGARLGKGGGYSDLEFALASSAGKITSRTVILTTVHPLQIVEDGEIPMTRHDVPLDFIVTPDEIIETEKRYSRPEGIYWDELDEKKVEAIPVLKQMRDSGEDG